MASDELRRAWAELIDPSDYDVHMANIGQAEANARLVRTMITDHPLQTGERLLFAGAGTGQMFDYVSADFLEPYDVTFADIRHDFLERLLQRLPRAKTVVDDLEASRLQPDFGGVVLVLVLEHVDWRKALEQVVGLGPTRLYIILQVNPPDLTDAVAPNRVLPPSMANLPPGTKSGLLDVGEVHAFLRERGFPIAFRLDVAVPDGKTMAGIVFHKR